ELPDPNPDGLVDHLIFWPIGQELFAELARDLLDEKSADWRDAAALLAALRPLSVVNWELHAAPWQRLILVGPSAVGQQWKMRSEERKAATEVATRVMRWVLNLDPLDSSEVDELRDHWALHLYRGPDDATLKRMWSEVTSMRKAVVQAK